MGHKKDKDKKKKKRKHSSEDDFKSEVKEPKEEPMDEYHPDERDSDSPDVKSEPESDGSDWGASPKKKKKTHAKKKPKKEAKVKSEPGDKKRKSTTKEKSPTKKRVKKEEVEQPKWKWWEEDPEEKKKREEAGIKWKTLEHKGPMFPPEYERLPKNVHFKYAGEKMVLSEGAEEVMGFYAAMLRTDYVTDPKKSELFNKNFFEKGGKKKKKKKKKKS